MIKQSIHDSNKARYDFSKSFVKNKNVLDVACAFGGGTKLLAEAAGQITAIDLNETDIAYAKEYETADNVVYAIGDVTNLSYADNTFEAATALEIIEHLDEPDQRKLLAELRRVVKPAGTVIISTPDKDVWHKELVISQHDHKRELTKKELGGLLQEYFDITGWYGQWKMMPEISASKRIVRGALNALKKADVLGIRRMIVPKTARKAIDKNTAAVDQTDWHYEPLNENELAAQVLVVCENRK